MLQATTSVLSLPLIPILIDENDIVAFHSFSKLHLVTCRQLFLVVLFSDYEFLMWACNVATCEEKFGFYS